MTPLTKPLAHRADPLLDRCDDPAAALLALDNRFHGDVERWLVWLRWLDETAYRAE